MGNVPKGMSRIRWWWVRLVTAGQPTRCVYWPAQGPTGTRTLRMYDRSGRHVAVLHWQVCDACRYGKIKAIYLWRGWQGRGYGRQLIARALWEGPTYTWITTHQTPDGEGFFAAMAAETGAAFDWLDAGCPHLHDYPTLPAPAARSTRPPVVERMDAAGVRRYRAAEGASARGPIRGEDHPQAASSCP